MGRSARAPGAGMGRGVLSVGLRGGDGAGAGWRDTAGGQGGVGG
ncbi:MAG: hypothetical protein OXS33_07675 [bacterium]|nr:hypothetical protein [bacterium]